MRKLAARVTGVLLFWVVLVGGAETTYQSPEQFVDEAFDGFEPAPEVLWVTDALRDQAGSVLGHQVPFLRTRYWQDGNRTAWILDEIGKEQPITVGIVVEDARIERVRVLVYRESRGGEVRHAYFTRQFKGAALVQDDFALDRTIDGISGATLSSRALTRVSRLALLFHSAVMDSGGGE
ncbi:MAG: FMN-binding protein [Pseudomonadota bacterium]|nr:FMN-binding protein [Pseudomonadota bacterium]